MFHRPSFSPVSFSPISFNGASQPVVQEARSGYWRLFYTQLQEQALKKKAVVVEPEFKEPYKLKEQKDGSVVVQFPVKKKPVVVEPEEKIEFIVPPFKRIDAPQQPDLLPNVLRTNNDVTLLIAQHNLFAIQSQKLINDQDDDDVEMLLLLVA